MHCLHPNLADVLGLIEEVLTDLLNFVSAFMREDELLPEVEQDPRGTEHTRQHHHVVVQDYLGAS